MIVEKLSKLVTLIAIPEHITSQETTQLIWMNVVAKHGLPLNIVSDRDPRFTSKYWKQFWGKLVVNLAMSTSQHPQTDGQTERSIQVFEQVLRFACGNHPEEWRAQLLCVDFGVTCVDLDGVNKL